ncbi:MAG: DUF262 domain-containing protein [Chloroflexota bacterium]|nr:DUF262 domain-containing protein [Chloroflexota bacterium]
MVMAEEEELLVEETEPSDDEEVQDVRYDIMPYPADYTLKGLYDKWQAGQLLIPDYQRNYVWTQKQASQFIESFLLGLPVPQVFLYRDRSDPRLTVIDGHQRLSTIARFYSGEFRLRDVNSLWAGRAYDDLSDYDRPILDDSTLRAIIIRQIQPDNNSSMYQIFRRLNTGGTQLNDMEIRRAISFSREGAVGFLDRLNENDDWRSIIGTSEPAKRFRDVELVLRVLALSEKWMNYGEREYGGQSMKAFMDKYMEVLDKEDSPTLDQLEERFNEACRAIASQLGEKPFHLRGRLNLGALDSVMACAIELGESLKEQIKEEYATLRENDEFLAAVTHDTSHTTEVKQRFNLVHSAFSG